MGKMTEKTGKKLNICRRCFKTIKNIIRNFITTTITLAVFGAYLFWGAELFKQLQHHCEDDEFEETKTGYIKIAQEIFDLERNKDPNAPFCPSNTPDVQIKQRLRKQISNTLVEEEAIKGPYS